MRAAAHSSAVTPMRVWPPHWFRAFEVTPGRTGTYHPHFHVLLMVSAKYFEPGSLSYIAQAEWHVVWEQCLRADGGRIVDTRLTENPGEVAKYVTRPGAYLKFAGAADVGAIPNGLKRCTKRLARDA